jgi:1D-myo-inositol 3-kinase
MANASPLPPSLPPDFVVIGNLTRDERRTEPRRRVPGPNAPRSRIPQSVCGARWGPGSGAAEYDLGGTATYAAITARNLGYRAGILTRAAESFPQRELLRDIQIERLASDRTTTFRNIYDEHGRRHQFVRDVAEPIDAACLPASWGSAKIALLGPIAREVETPILRQLGSRTLIGVVPQGWLRQWDDSGRVSVRSWIEAPEILPHARVLVLSEEDLGEFAERLNDYIALTEIVVLTRGARGCTVFRQGHEPFDSPAFHAREFDPTGAGDVFTAAFLVRLHETGDIAVAARFANCVASFAVEAEGVTGIPSRAMVEQRLLGE